MNTGALIKARLKPAKINNQQVTLSITRLAVIFVLPIPPPIALSKLLSSVARTHWRTA